MKKLVIFDFDGTLFDSVDDVVICFNEALSMHNFPTLTKKEYLEVLGGNIDEVVSLILKDRNSKENMGLIKETYGELYSNSDKRNTLPFPNSGDVLRKLQERNIFIAINSNRSTDSIKYFVNEFFSDIDFVLIEGHNPEYPSKPSPIGVENIVKKAGVSLDEAIYVGDSKTDIKTAKNAKIDCILVSWGYGSENDLKDDSVLEVIDDINQLLDLEFA
ncbi:HAD family hydrolase [uncultured Methanobrevibacter sp.]|uniref:HAD family hydrolase n=1 Tax=uncultured Methanobrevibacter sp. TaxID=253161 RepID=UPI0025DB509A|nr:HAD family hydrolase [uncultured Methanobrevibacter sp.]